MPSRVAECCGAIGRALDGLGVRWFLFGAQAAILHGVRRFTADVDITVDAGDRSTREIVAALTAEGIVLRVTDADEFVAATRVLPMRHASSGLPVDVVLAGPGIEEGYFARSVAIEVSGVRVPVARLEDLIVMKVLAGRPTDDQDVVTLLGANEVELDTVRAGLRELEALLDQSDLIPAFEAAVSRAAAAKRRR